MAANIYKRRGVVTGRKKNQPAQRLFVLTIFQDFTIQTCKAQKHHKFN